jgi:hypothetical protein
MPQEKIQFGPNLESSFDPIGGSSPSAINVIIDKNGVVYKRPGITEYTGVAPSTVVDSTGISGLYAANNGKLFAVGNGENSKTIYQISNGSAASAVVNGSDKLIGNKRPTFTETEVFLILAAGLDIQKVNLTTFESNRLGGSPPLASHVAANSLRILANDTQVDKTKVRYSGISQGTTDTTGHETWGVGNDDDGGFFTAEARPDNVVAIADNTNEIFVWGTDNVQVFSPDASLIFAPTATREFGTSAPYSIIKRDQDFFWLDQYRRIVYSDGRQFQNIDKPIKRKLDSLTNITDCFGYRVLLGHIDCMVWCFPSDGTTLVYQVEGGWSEWNGWDAGNANFRVLQILSHYLRRDGGVNVIGTVDGKIGKLSQDAFSDLGELVVARAESGFLDRGTPNRKLCKSVKIEARRGASSTVSLGRLEWQDSTGQWQGPLTIDFGSTGDYTLTKEIRSLGIYNRRNWRFTFSDSANLALVRVVEDFEVLSV